MKKKERAKIFDIVESRKAAGKNPGVREDGQLEFQISSSLDSQRIIFDFNTEISWFQLTIEQTEAVVGVLQTHIARLKGIIS